MHAECHDDDMKIGRLFCCLIMPVLAAPAFAACPTGADHFAQIESLVLRMQVAPHGGAARVLSDEMWQIWLQAPDSDAQALLDEGVALLQMGAHSESRARLIALVRYCPNYAEGYNQRAFAAFLQGDLEAALLDLHAAIALQPVHLGALTGKVLTLIRLGRDAEAQVVLRNALSINPWLAERALLDGSLGRDI